MILQWLLIPKICIATRHIQMEPANNNASNLVGHEVLDDNLEKIVQDFNEFQRMSGASTMTLKDLIDIYITSGGVNSPVDSNEPKSTVPPHQEQSADGFNFDDILLTDIMADGTTDDMSQNDTGSFPDTSAYVNTSDSRVTHLRYGDLKCQGVAERIMGSGSAETVFHTFMSSLKIPGAGKKNLRRQVHVKKDSNGTTRRKYSKRKYKQIIETKEDAAHQMEITTLKNKGAVAEARAKRQVSSNTLISSTQENAHSTT